MEEAGASVMVEGGGGETGEVLLIQASRMEEVTATYSPSELPGPSQPSPAKAAPSAASTTPSAPSATTRTRRFYCQECNRDFGNQYGLSNHYTKTHRTERDPRYIRKINHQRHRKAAYLRPEMVEALAGGTEWRVPAETPAGLVHRVHLVVAPDDCRCQITCNYIDCKVCLCRYLCSCTDWPQDDIPCQHIHFVHIHFRQRALAPEALGRVRALNAAAKGKEERQELREYFFGPQAARKKPRQSTGKGDGSAKKARGGRAKAAKRPAEAGHADQWAQAEFQGGQEDNRYYLEDELWAFNQKLQRLGELGNALADAQNVARASAKVAELMDYVSALEGRKVVHVLSEPSLIAVHQPAQLQAPHTAPQQQHTELQLAHHGLVQHHPPHPQHQLHLPHQQHTMMIIHEQPQ